MQRANYYQSCYSHRFWDVLLRRHCYTRSPSRSLAPSAACVIGCVFLFFMWCSFSIRCVFHYQISEQWTNHPKFTCYSCLDCLLSPYNRQSTLFIYLFQSSSSSKCVCAPSAYCLRVPFLSVYSTSVSDCEQCNDGIMIIAAKMAKDLKCDNFCMCCVALSQRICERTNLRVRVCEYCQCCLCIDCFSATIPTVTYHVCESHMFTHSHTQLKQ